MLILKCLSNSLHRNLHFTSEKWNNFVVFQSVLLGEDVLLKCSAHQSALVSQWRNNDGSLLG